MIGNYIITTLRHLKKDKLYSLINILGLTVGATGCLLILYYVNFEKSYDRFHENRERIYRLRYERADQDGGTVRFASCCPPAAPRIRSQCPEVEKAGRIFRYMASVSRGDNKFLEERMFFAEPEFLEILQFKFVEGDPLNGIRGHSRAFLSRSAARKYFGDQDPIGQTISVDKKVDYQVTGIFEDVPHNSHVKFDVLLSYPNLIDLYGEDIEDSWGDTGFFTYLRLRPGADVQAFEKKLAGIVDAEFGEALRAYKLTCDLPLQPLDDIHLTSHFQQELEVNGDADIVAFLSIIAVLIIIIAWVNYVNLSTARALTRAREVGLRKVVGASRAQLMAQFFMETIIVNVLAIVLTLGAVESLRPLFSQITGVPVDYVIWAQPWFWNAVLLLLFVGVVSSGLYPVMVLSSFKPVTVLRGKLGVSRDRIGLRSALVVFQFVMAIALITATVTVSQQLSFIKNQALGFSIDQKVVIRAPRVRDASFGTRLKTFKNQLLANPAINKFCVATEVPGRQIMWDAGGIRRVGTDDNRNYQIVGIDYDFVDVFDLTILHGRNFSTLFPSDSSALILNETAAAWMGFKSSESALGQQIQYWDKIFTVVGIMKDYHQQSSKQAFEPHIFRLMPEGRGVRGMFTLTISPQNVAPTITMVRKRFDEFFPGNPFEYFFLSEYYSQQYEGDERFETVFGIFSFLALFVTCLGILGLSSFMVLQRTKEIGIRKVLGAGAANVIFMLSKDFLLLVAIAFLVAFPLSYLGIRRWLESFATRMDLTVWLFLAPLAVVGTITCITICLHVIKAALANPVESLRCE